MTFPFLLRKNKTVNLVITDYSIRFIELKPGKPLVWQKWGERFLPPGVILDGKIIDSVTLSSILEECIDEWKIHRRQVRFLVPDSSVSIRKVSIPADIKNDEINGYVYLEIGSTIHLPFEDPVFDFIVLKEKPDRKDLLLFAAQEQKVLMFSELLSGLKLKPVAADLSPLALYRLYFHLDLAEPEEHLLAVRFDLNLVSICIFENHLPLFMHQFSIDFSKENWDLMFNRDGHQEYVFIGEASVLRYQFEDILKEMHKLMDFYCYSLQKGKKQVTKILLSGDHPMLGGFYEEMSHQLDLPIVLLDGHPFFPGKGEALPPSLYLALGLSLKEVE